METSVTRPDDLPDFGKPPLDEVVLGVQFSPPANYQQIRAGEVWALYKEKFPMVEEYPPIPPMFETFGRPGEQQLSFGVTVGAQHDRFWFVSPSGEQLIQFQNDRLMHNWRKRGPAHEYPRYEAIIDQFEEEAKALETFFKSLGSDLAVNQCEISYINHLNSFIEDELFKPADWLCFAGPLANEFEDFRASFRRSIKDDFGRPTGRLICEAGSAVRQDGRPMISLSITARGVPKDPSLQSSLEFLGRGREMIVKLFAEVTTDSAHELWERKK